MKKPTVIRTVLAATLLMAATGCQDKEVLIKSFGTASPHYSGEVKSVELLGHGTLAFTNGEEGLTVTLPEEPTNRR